MDNIELKARKRRPHEHRQRTTGFPLTMPALLMTVRSTLGCPIILQLIDGNRIPCPRGPPISDVGRWALMAASLQSGHSINFPGFFPTVAGPELECAAMISSVSS